MGGRSSIRGATFAVMIGAGAGVAVWWVTTERSQGVGCRRKREHNDDR